jgi:anti-anti-sigma regulatory factor
LECSGHFSGFEEGPSGSVLDYLEGPLRCGRKRLHLVFAKVDYFNDVAPWSVVELAIALRERGGDLVMTDLNQGVMEVVERLGCSEDLGICSSEEAAKKRLDT